MTFTLGIAAVEQDDYFPFGKQTFYFEDMVRTSADLPVDLFFFSPLSWERDCRQVQGFIFKDGAWRESSAPFPEIIYDRSFVQSKEGKQKLEEFRNNHKELQTPFLNPVDLANLLNNKVEFHQFLTEKGFPTLPAFPVRDILSEKFLDAIEYGKGFFLKPIFGTGGFGIFDIEKQHDIYLLINHTNTKRESFNSLDELFRHISDLLNIGEYFIQEKAELSAINNCPFDIRVIVQNSGRRDYQVTGSGVRIGKESSLVSNLNSGGTAIAVEELVDHYMQHFGKDITSEIGKMNDICLECSEALHHEYGNFLEIGYDILLTNNKGPIIIEANTRPSRWIFNAIADKCKGRPGLEQKYRNLRFSTVRTPVLFAAKNYKSL